MEVSEPCTLILVTEDDGSVWSFRWYGGHGVGIFDSRGIEIDYFTMGSDTADLSDFVAAVREHVAGWGV